jgi:A/G-specific adenine glycosylase
MSDFFETAADDRPAPDPRVVQSGVLEWFDAHRRDLPWRHTREPYRILVSEVMLQQTQVDRVIPYYHRFLGAFPTVEALASAPTAEVIRLWAGLGYNRRAVNLQRTARAIVEDHGGVFPRDMAVLRTLPGIGAYTAGAIACFAFEHDVAFLDTNMRRVIARIYSGESSPLGAAGERALHETALELVPAGDGWRWNQALMEFGALHCTARKPLCMLCPLREHCRAFPDVLTAGLARAAAPAPETPFNGSSRYYRGRVLDVLREQHEAGQPIELDALGRRIRPDYTEAERAWLAGLVRGLERDGLAAVAEDSPAYDASQPETMRITLP